jgi:hypothetical protein
MEGFPVNQLSLPLPNLSSFPYHLADAYLHSRCESLMYWDGECHLLAHEIMKWLDHQGVSSQIVWVRREHTNDHLFPTGRATGRIWRFHAAIEVEGVVHDPWYDVPLPRAEWEAAMFPGQRLRAFCGRPTPSDISGRVYDPTYSTP